MRNSSTTFGMLVVMVGLGLTGCGDLSKSISLDSEEDTLQGVKAPPLSLPPDYNLRPPVPGGRGAPDRLNVDQARQSVFGINDPGFVSAGAGTAPITETGQRSAGESALLKKANAESGSDDTVREAIDDETQDLKASESGFVEKVLNWDEDAAPEGESLETGGVVESIIVSEEKPIIKRKGTIFD